MVTLFISDLHLCKARPKTSELFLNFLLHYAKDIDALYILGDFFEAWIGEDIMDDHDIKILNALYQFGQKTPVYFMPGNRDFLINQRVANRFGGTVLNDPTVINLYGQSILLMHGDSLCTLDKAYQYYRRFVQHPLIQKAFLSLPAALRRLIANRLRNKASRESKPKYADNTADSARTIARTIQYWDVVQDSVQQALQKHQTQLLIHGHTHKPGMHDFQLNNKPAKRVVLGDWNETGVVLAYSPQTLQLQTIG